MASKRRLLIVDDDPLIINFLSAALASSEWDIATAADAMAAFMIARDQRPFMILTDVQMPAFGSGTDMVRALRLEKATALTPVLVITGLTPERAQPLLPQDDPLIRLMSKPPDIDAIFRIIFEMTGVNGMTDDQSSPVEAPQTDPGTEPAAAEETEVQLPTELELPDDSPTEPPAYSRFFGEAPRLTFYPVQARDSDNRLEDRRFP